MVNFVSSVVGGLLAGSLGLLIFALGAYNLFLL